MEKPIVLVWEERLDPEVIKSQVLETGLAPAPQERGIDLEIEKLTKPARESLARCMEVGGWLMVESSLFGAPKPVRLAVDPKYHDAHQGKIRFPSRTVPRFFEGADAMVYACDCINRALAAVLERGHLIAEREAEQAFAKAEQEAKIAEREAEQKARAKARRESLAAFVAAHGTPSQKERFAAGVLPDDEIEARAKAFALEPLTEIATYERIVFGDLAHASGCNATPSSEDEETTGDDGESFLATNSTDHEQGSLPPMSPELWEGFSSIVKTLPSEVSWTLREHRVRCMECNAVEERWSMLLRVPTKILGVVASLRIAV